MSCDTIVIVTDRAAERFVLWGVGVLSTKIVLCLHSSYVCMSVCMYVRQKVHAAAADILIGKNKEVGCRRE